MLPLWSTLPPARRALLTQIARYLVAGGIATALQAGTYWLLVRWGGVHPQLANFAGYLVAVASGFVLHGAITFKDHGARAGSGAARGARFVAVSLVSLAVNAFWVWLTTSALHWPDWSPIPFMALVTPALIFTLNRQWVFR